MEDVYDTDPPLGIRPASRPWTCWQRSVCAHSSIIRRGPGLGHFVKRGDGFYFEPEAIEFV
jgi:hypothetical protein